MMKASGFTDNNPINWFYWIGLSAVILVADYLAGPFVQFPVTYLVPVALASWYSGRWWGLAFSIMLPLVRFYFNVALWTVPWTIVEATLNTVIRIVVLSSFAVVIDRTARQTRKLSREVQLLEGLLPICSFCKKIRDENDRWEPMESYIAARTAATFSHGLCPDCLREHYGDVFKNEK